MPESATMKSLWEYSSGYHFWRPYVDFCARSTFSRVEIEGKERIPGGYVILAPNHCCTLMDALMILLLYPRDPVCFGARADIFRKERMARALRWLKILPLSRERDGIREVAKDLDTFEEMTECLRHGLPVCMFSEGRHRAERGMLPVKKGIFRLAREASAKLGAPVNVVPVGLDYEDFFRPGGTVAIRIGEAIPIASQFDGLTPDKEVYETLCEDLRRRDLGLIGKPPSRRRHPVLAALLSPAVAVAAVLSLPISLAAAVLIARAKDKAWAHTYTFALKLVLPLFLPFHIVLWWFLRQFIKPYSHEKA